MIARLRKAAGSPFARAVGVLTGGKAVAMILPILAAPILGRLYDPADYGVLALYMSVASLLGVVGTLQYQTAIIAEPSLRQARLLVYLCLILGAGFAVLMLPLAALAWATFLSQPTYLDARAWVFAIPVTAISACFVAGMSTLANRRSRYRLLASVSVASVCFSVGFSILFGLLGLGVHGLMLGYFAGQAAQVAMYARQWRGLMCCESALGRARLLVLARRYRRFPLFSMPSAFLNNFNMQLPIFVLGALGATQVLGQFSRARQLVSMPMTLLGGAVAQVYRQRAAELYRDTGTCRPLLLRTGLVLSAAGVLPCVAFMASAPQLFAVYLGEPWREAGEIARILAPMLLLRLVSTPLSTTFFFTGRQRTDLALSVASLLLIGGGIWVAAVTTRDPFALVLAYSVTQAATYFCYLVASWWIADDVGKTEIVG